MGFKEVLQAVYQSLPQKEKCFVALRDCSDYSLLPISGKEAYSRAIRYVASLENADTLFTIIPHLISSFEYDGINENPKDRINKSLVYCSQHLPVKVGEVNIVEKIRDLGLLEPSIAVEAGDIAYLLWILKEPNSKFDSWRRNQVALLSCFQGHFEIDMSPRISASYGVPLFFHSRDEMNRRERAESSLLFHSSTTYNLDAFSKLNEKIEETIQNEERAELLGKEDKI